LLTLSVIPAGFLGFAEVSAVPPIGGSADLVLSCAREVTNIPDSTIRQKRAFFIHVFLLTVHMFLDGVNIHSIYRWESRYWDGSMFFDKIGNKCWGISYIPTA